MDEEKKEAEADIDFPEDLFSDVSGIQAPNQNKTNTNNDRINYGN